MAKVLYDQFTAPVDEGGSDLTPGIDCEVGKVFPWCVGVGGLIPTALGTDRRPISYGN
jgi:hypothetical protein